MSRVERMFDPRESWGKWNGTPSVSEADSSPITCGTGEPLEGREEKKAGIRKGFRRGNYVVEVEA